MAIPAHQTTADLRMTRAGELSMLRGEVAAYQESPLCGDSCHVLLEDLNLEDEWVEDAYTRCVANGDTWGASVVNQLRPLDVRERYLVATGEWPWTCWPDGCEDPNCEEHGEEVRDRM